MTNPDSEKRTTQMMAEANRLWKLEERIRNRNKPQEKPEETHESAVDPTTKLREYMRRCVQSGTVSDFPGDIQFDAVARLYDLHLDKDGLRPVRPEKLREDFDNLTHDQQVAVILMDAFDDE